MAGAEFVNQVHLQPLPLRGHATEQNSTNKDILNRMSSCVKLLSDGKTRQIFLDAPKVLAKTSQCVPSFADRCLRNGDRICCRLSQMFGK